MMSTPAQAQAQAPVLAPDSEQARFCSMIRHWYVNDSFRKVVLKYAPKLHISPFEMAAALNGDLSRGEGARIIYAHILNKHIRRAIVAIIHSQFGLTSRTVETELMQLAREAKQLASLASAGLSAVMTMPHSDLPTVQSPRPAGRRS